MLKRTLDLAPIVIAVTATFAATLVSAADGIPDETLLLQQPTISATHIVFVYAEDLWIVNRDGGDARRLTSSPGSEQFPRLSPDGRWVAFTGQYEGNSDVYVIPVEGGAPRRLTWHPGFDQVRDWHPDGSRVLFGSSRASGVSVRRLFLIRVEGGVPEPLALPRVSHAAYNAAGTKLAYTPVRDAFATWKRYRGGRTTPLWICDLETFHVDQVPHARASDTFPCWIGDTVYFASDRDGVMNVWRYDAGAHQVEQITRFPDYHVRSMSSDGHSLVFEQGGAIHCYEPETVECSRVPIRVRDDGLDSLPRWQEAKDFVRSAAVAPNGKRVVFEARGEIISVPREHGDARNLTNTPGVHERTPVWSPDGNEIAWFSDESGEYELIVSDQLGRDAPRSFDLGGGGFYHDPVWSPDGNYILFTDKTNRIAYLTLADGVVTDVARVAGSLGVVRPRAVWSADNQWIAFEDRNPDTTYDRVALYELATGTTTRLTDDFCNAGDPSFSRDGKYLFFSASVDSGPQRFGLNMMSAAARRAENSLYVTVLQKGAKNPLAPKSDEAVDRNDASKKNDRPPAIVASQDGASDEDSGDDEDSPPDSEDKAALPGLDLEGIDQRILALPLPRGRYSNLICSKKKLLFIQREGTAGSLKSFDFDKREAKTVAKDARGAEVSADGGTVLVTDRKGFKLMSDSGDDSKSVSVDAVKVRVEPRSEWAQILREAWRLQRDYFYDPQMHGVDWPAMWERWEPFLKHVKHRSDLNLVLSELIGELSCGHEYVGGGATPPAPTGVSVGLLGADFVVEEGRHRIVRIYQGQNWNPGLRAPLTEPGVDAREGDYLIAINGRPLSGSDNLYAAFENTAGKQVDLELSATPSEEDTRTVTVVPVRSESRLRNLSWVEENRQRVADRSGGRLGYIYMPNTGAAGMAAFDRDFYSQLGKDGLIIDERYNGGGKVADYVIEVLSRQVQCYWMNREQWVSQSPFAAFAGPKVMVINERAGSGGDALPWLFRKAGLGPLVGTRTWGGLVGISGYPPLMDGGFLTAASFGIMDREGNWVVENEGVAPDFEVVEWPNLVVAGADPQLDKAIEVALDLLEEHEPPERPTYRPPAPR